MRRGWPAKQCLWVGPDRHRGRRGDTVTNSEPESYANSNGYSFSVWPDGDADADLYSYSDCNTYSDGHSYSYSNAQTDAHAQVCADTEASSDTAAQTVTVFAKANIVASGHRLMSDRS
jgi:hypothetical protein